MVTASDFRDKSLSDLHISYDWASSSGMAELAMVDSLGVIRRYRLSGLSQVSIFEDFGCQAISQCTLIIEPGNVYLSLDPYTEGKPSQDDALYFVAAAIEHLG